MSSSYIANNVKLQTSELDIVDTSKERKRDLQSSEGNECDNKSSGNHESIGKEKAFDLSVRLCEDQYPLLAKRLYRDIQNMELYDVFRNQILKDHQICRAFIGVLKSKSYKDLKSLFLSSQDSIEKIVNKQECVLEESGDVGWREERLRQEMLLDQKYERDSEGKILWNECTHSVRAISWVICYGHHHVLRYIIKQTERHGEQSELFRIEEDSKPGMLEKVKSMIYHSERKEEASIEQLRLLLLSFYSGDEETVKAILPHVCMRSIYGIGNANRK
jgi:hypothetical protein